MYFKKLFLKEFNIPYSGEQEFDQLTALINDFKNYIIITQKIEENILIDQEEKKDTLQKRYEITKRFWEKMISPKLERMQQMDPSNFKFLPKILTIPTP